jgi:hypothetical protein
MVAWSNWKPFPDPRHGPPIEAPGGPGVYEVRRISTGDVVVFDDADNVAATLAVLASAGSRSLVARLQVSPGDLEYRACAAASRTHARSLVAHLNTQRRVALRQVLQM